MKTVDIIERIEGEAKLNLFWENEKVKDARIDFLNFRGFEFILENKPVLDSLIYTPRVCGICGQAHLLTTVKALESLYENSGIKIILTNKAKILRELGLVIEIIDSHIKWFYMFIMPDIVKLSDKEYVGYTPLKGKKWLESQAVVSEFIKSLAIFAGQWPHTSYMIPGGVMSDPTRLEMVSCENYIDSAINFFENSLVNKSIEEYLSFTKVEDLFKIGGALKDFIDISFEKELTTLGKSFNRHLVLSNSFGLKPTSFKNGQLSHANTFGVSESSLFSFDKDNREKEKSHTWSKRAEYNKEAFEVGPLSRAVVSDERVLINDIHKKFDDSVFTRVMARMDEIPYLLFYAKKLLKNLNLTEESYLKPKIDINSLENVKGEASVEACRGSLIHQLEVDKGVIQKYNIITPSVWNLGPQSEIELGIAQNAIIGSKSLLEATIILRSFDVCSVCTAH